MLVPSGLCKIFTTKDYNNFVNHIFCFLDLKIVFQFLHFDFDQLKPSQIRQALLFITTAFMTFEDEGFLVCDQMATIDKILFTSQ